MSKGVEPATPGALDGLRILDLAGPTGVYCAKLLADLGADVIRVEPPCGDTSRRLGPFYQDAPDPEHSLFHWHYNANKRGVTLDLTTSEGQTLFKGLVATADVMVETYQPGYLDSLGLGYSALEAINPRVILTSITPFGQDGPYRDYLGDELICQAAGGLLWICGWPDRPPVMMGGWPALHQVSAEAAAAALLAVAWRDKTGAGQHVDVSVQASLPLSLMAGVAEYHATGKQNARCGDYHPGPLNGMFRCSDGYADFRYRGRPGRWQRIVAWMDTLGMAEDLGEDSYLDNAYRRRPENWQHIDATFQRFILHFKKEEAMETGQRVGLEVGAVYNAAEVLQDPQLAARHFSVQLEHPELGRSFSYPGEPYRLLGTPWQLRRRAPLLGEHNAEVFGKELEAVDQGSEGKGAGIEMMSPERQMENPLPLAGIRVVDFTQYAAGPLVAKLLADYGAEVITVESETYIRSGGGSRQTGPPGLSPINTAYFHNKFNSNKMSVTVDMSHPGALDIAKRLIRVSDVFLCSLRPHVLDNWGLTYDVVREVRPDIIYLTMPTMGEGGPRSFYGGVSWGIQAMAGLNMISGYPDRPPTSPTKHSHPDVSSNPMHAMVAVLAALQHRRRTGQGQRIELSQYESTVCWTGPALLQYAVNGTLMERTANRHPLAAPHDVYRCQGDDRWCAITVYTDEQWGALCNEIGRSELADHPSYATLSARQAHEEDLRGIIEPWTAQQEAEEVMRRLQAVHVPCAAANEVGALLRRDAQLKARGLWTEVEHPELGTVMVEGWAFRLSKASPPTRRAPLLGEHNDYVFQEVLGLSEEEVNMNLVEGLFQ